MSQGTASGSPMTGAHASDPALSKDDWRTVFALLDTALELEPAAHADWLESLGAEHDKLLPMLRTLLHDQPAMAASGFMQPPPGIASSAPRPASPPEPAPRDLVGPYRLLREIGQGGMASVWLAERADGLLDRRVALKLPHASLGSSSFAERMARERNILASLTHPNIARLYDVGTAADGRPFLALEYIDGQPIDTYAATRASSVRERVELVIQVARAVAHAHAQLVVHRDLKPSNILVDAEGRAHLLDFGIAKLIDPPQDGAAEDAQATLMLGRALTPDYASPEQIRGDAIGTASDVYSLGIVLFELLAGARPYRLPREAGAAALAELVAQVDVPRPSAVAADAGLCRQLQGDLDAIVGRALRKPIGERYATIDALADDLERHLRGEPVRARPDSRWYLAERWVRRHKLETAVAAAILVAVPAGAVAQAAVLAAIGAGATIALWQMRVARQQAGAARNETARAEQVKDFTLSILQAANTDAGAGGATTVADLLKAAQSRIEVELAGRPEISVELMTSVGDGLLGLGQFDDAADILHKAVRLAKSELGPRHPHTPAAMVAYASVLVNLNRWSEAIPLLLPAIAEARRRHLTRVLVDGLRWLSSCSLQSGDFDAGVAHSQAAIDAVVAAGNAARKLDAVNAWASMGSALDAAQRAGVADAARRSLAHARELYGDRTTESVLMVRILLAKGLATEGRDVEALAELDSALADTIQFFGPTYPRIEAIANFRGHVRLNAGDVAGAIADFRMQLAAGSQTNGVAGVNLGLGHSSLAKALAAARLDEEALQHYEISERLFREATDAGHPHALRSLSVRAFLLMRLGRLDEAEQGFSAIAEAPWRGSDQERAAHLGRLSKLRSLQGRHEDAITLARESVEALRANPATIIRATAMGALGTALLAAGRAAEAIEPLRVAALLYAEKQLMMSPDQADAIAALADAEAALGSLPASAANP